MALGYIQASWVLGKWRAKRLVAWLVQGSVLVREREGGDGVPDPLAQATLSALRLTADICTPGK